MEGNATGKPFKMKGHTLPGINQRSEGNTDLPDGRSASAALQYKSPLYNTESKAKNMTKIDKKTLGTLQKPAEGYEWVMLDGKPSQVKSPTTYASPAKKPEDLLVGNRKNLPEDLKAEISAAPYKAPTKKYKKQGKTLKPSY